MGIQGLLPMLRSVSVLTHLRELRGLTCAVDTYAWLHRGVYSCAGALAEGLDVDGFVKFSMRMVDLLIMHGIRPIMVLDGSPLLAKRATESSRSAARANNREQGRFLWSQGRRSEANKFYAKAVDVTPEMARKLIAALKKRSIEYVVAPYEADAQLAYLCLTKAVDFVVSEDSDTLPFGCTKVLFKLDSSGTGQMIDSRMIHQATELNFQHFTQDMFLNFCILCGCDYLESVSQVGPKRAHDLVSRFRSADQILRALRFEAKGVGAIPEDYERRFHLAFLAFRHQTVFCPKQREHVPLRPLILSENETEAQREEILNFLGPRLESEVACGIADGEYHPETLQPYPESLNELIQSQSSEYGYRSSSSTPSSTGRASAATPSSTATSTSFKTLDSFLFAARTQATPNKRTMVVEATSTTKRTMLTYSRSVPTPAKPVDLSTAGDSASASSVRRSLSVGNPNSSRYFVTTPPPMLLSSTQKSQQQSTTTFQHSSNSSFGKFALLRRTEAPSEVKRAVAAEVVCLDGADEEAENRSVTATPRRKLLSEFVSPRPATSESKPKEVVVAATEVKSTTSMRFQSFAYVAEDEDNL